MQKKHIQQTHAHFFTNEPLNLAAVSECMQLAVVYYFTPTYNRGSTIVYIRVTPTTRAGRYYGVTSFHASHKLYPREMSTITRNGGWALDRKTVKRKRSVLSVYEEDSSGSGSPSSDEELKSAAITR